MYPLTFDLSFDCPPSAGDAEEVRRRCQEALEAAFARGLCVSGPQILVGPGLLSLWEDASLPRSIAAKSRWTTADHQVLIGSGAIEVVDGSPIRVFCSFSLWPSAVLAAAVAVGAFGLCLAVNALSLFSAGVAMLVTVFVYLFSVAAASDIDPHLRRAVGAPVVQRASWGVWAVIGVLLFIGAAALLWAAASGLLDGFGLT